MAWIEILDYGDFYDVPRCIVVNCDGVLYAFDCPFDEELDEYGASYEVFRLPDSARDLAAARFTPWDGVLRLGRSIGRVPVATVRFDESRRRAIDDSVFDLV